MSRSQILSLWLSFPTYLGVSTLWFGDPLSPLWLVTLWHDRLGVLHWRLAIIFGIAAAAIIIFKFVRSYIHAIFMGPLLVATSMSLSIVIIGLYAETRRQIVIHGFGADEVISSSFFYSIREAPREFQFFLHAAALKNCAPYAWSYREMGFYALPPNIAVNVLPPEWIAKCDIRRNQ